VEPRDDVGSSLAEDSSRGLAGRLPPSLPERPASGQALTRTRPGRRIALGLVGLFVLFGGALGATVFIQSRLSADASSSPQESRRSGIDGTQPSSFTESLLDIGWVQYESADGDFTLALPPSWSRYTKDIPNFGPDLKFAAWGISYERHGAPWLYVARFPVDAWQEEQVYFEQVRLHVSASPRNVRVSELRQIQLPDGDAYTFTSVDKLPSGRRQSETLYGIHHVGYEYRMVFLVRLEHKDETDFLYEDIARTLDIRP